MEFSPLYRDFSALTKLLLMSKSDVYVGLSRSAAYILVIQLWDVSQSDVQCDTPLNYNQFIRGTRVYALRSNDTGSHKIFRMYVCTGFYDAYNYSGLVRQVSRFSTVRVSA